MQTTEQVTLQDWEREGKCGLRAAYVNRVEKDHMGCVMRTHPFLSCQQCAQTVETEKRLSVLQCPSVQCDRNTRCGKRSRRLSVDSETCSRPQGLSP